MCYFSPKFYFYLLIDFLPLISKAILNIVTQLLFSGMIVFGLIFFRTVNIIISSQFQVLISFQTIFWVNFSYFLI